jgi:putative heme-binding domain-containing protein
MAVVLPALIGCSGPSPVAADEPQSAVPAIRKLLDSGRVPPSRLAVVFEQLARRGNAHDLAYLYEQAQPSKRLDDALRLTVFELLIDAAVTREAKPAGDLSTIAELIPAKQEASGELQRAAIRLAGLWKVSAAAAPLQAIVADPLASAEERQAALAALTAIGGPLARQTIVHLTGDEHPLSQRVQAVAALVELDLTLAAKRAASLLQHMTGRDDPAVIIEAFLGREGGSRQLADALSHAPPPKDVAMLALRRMFSAGRSDTELAEVLGSIAGIDANPQPLTPQQVADVARRVAAQGDASRGEAVFRRADLACLKCHAVSKAGGQVGPDLSALGASSPVDYIINSISNPDQQIKEEFTTRVVVTVDGRVSQGIVVDRTAERLVLKTADGKHVTIPQVEIDDEAAGQSLMPKGLMKFIADAEFVDLVKFLSLLGRPGTEYAIRDTPRMQRWRVLTDVSQAAASGASDEALLEESLISAAAAAPAYAHVNGDLPLDELADKWGPVLFLVGEVEVTRAGEVGIRLDSADGVQLSLGARTSQQPETIAPLSRGRHAILLRVDTAARSSPTLRMELFHVPGSHAAFSVVDGA